MCVTRTITTMKMTKKKFGEEGLGTRALWQHRIQFTNIGKRGKGRDLAGQAAAAADVEHNNKDRNEIQW